MTAADVLHSNALELIEDGFFAEALATVNGLIAAEAWRWDDLWMLKGHILACLGRHEEARTQFEGARLTASCCGDQAAEKQAMEAIDGMLAAQYGYPFAHAA